MGAVSIILFGFMLLFFAGVYTSTGGILTDFDSYPEQGVGWHWIAAAIQIPGVIVLTVRAISQYRAYKRRKRVKPSFSRPGHPVASGTATDDRERLEQTGEGTEPQG